MIKLDVADYCENCERFHPTTESTEFYGGGKVMQRETTVYCMNKSTCEHVYKAIKDGMKHRMIFELLNRGLPVVKVDGTDDGKGLMIRLDATKIKPNEMSRLRKEVEDAWRLGFIEEEG